jgi:hypothetical protein
MTILGFEWCDSWPPARPVSPLHVAKVLTANFLLRTGVGELPRPRAVDDARGTSDTGALVR